MSKSFQMEKSVDKEMGERETALFVQINKNLSRVRRKGKRKNIGRCVLLSVISIKFPDKRR